MLYISIYNLLYKYKAVPYPAKPIRANLRANSQILLHSRAWHSMMS